MIQVKCKRKTQKETNLSGRKDKKKCSVLGWEIGTCVTRVQQKFSVYGKNGERDRERERGKRIKEREIESNERMGWQLDSVFSELLFVDSFLTVYFFFEIIFLFYVFFFWGGLKHFHNFSNTRYTKTLFLP